MENATSSPAGYILSRASGVAVGRFSVEVRSAGRPAPGRKNPPITASRLAIGDSRAARASARMASRSIAGRIGRTAGGVVPLGICSNRLKDRWDATSATVLRLDILRMGLLLCRCCAERSVAARSTSVGGPWKKLWISSCDWWASIASALL